MANGIAITALALAAVAASQGLPLISEPTCTGACRVVGRRSLRIGAEDDSGLINGPPFQVLGFSLGRIIVVRVPVRPSDAPPAIFDSFGRHSAFLGRPGRGPGELHRPVWLHVGQGDTVRVYEEGRVLTFGPDLRHVRTLADRRPFRMAPNAILLNDGTLITTGLEPMHEERPRVIRAFRDGGKGRAVLPEPNVPYNGRATRSLGYAHNRRSGRFWVAQWASVRGVGYELVHMDTVSHLFTALRRHPSWWRSRAPFPGGISKVPGTQSRVHDVREVGNGLVAVLIAQPRHDADRMPFDSVKLEGYYSRYETILELIDVRRRERVGELRVPGYARNILDDRRFATYVEGEDGTPYVDIWTFEWRR